jgi:hypothetical protein
MSACAGAVINAALSKAVTKEIVFMMLSLRRFASLSI